MARRHALWTYYSDWHEFGHETQRTVRLDDFPVFASFEHESLDERWLLTPPDQMARDVIAVWMERFPLVLADVDALPPGSTLVEGAGCFPQAVAEQVDRPHRAVWLIPTPAFVRRVREERYAAGNSSALMTSDPARALANIIERDILLAEYVEREAVRLHLSTISIDGSRSIDAVADEVQALFDLPRSDMYVGTYESSDGRRVRVESAHGVLHFGRVGSQSFALQPRSDHLFYVEDGPFVGEIVRFETDSGSAPRSLMAASDSYRRVP